MAVSCLIVGTIAFTPDTVAQRELKTLTQLRLEDDAGHWVAGAMGSRADGPVTASLQYEYRMKGDAFGVLAGVQFWSFYEPWGALKLSNRLRLPTKLVTPHLTFGLMGVATGLGLGLHAHGSLGFDVNANTWLHPSLEVMRTSIKDDRFIFLVGISVRLAKPN